MHPSLPHLLSDIDTVHRTEIPEQEAEQSIEEYFEAIGRWLSGEETERTFGYYCELNPICFPSS